MKKILLFILIAVSNFSFAQIPGPPGCKIFSVIDLNNDGLASFNIDYYMNTYIKNLALVEHNYDLSGYVLTLHETENDSNNGSNALSSPYFNTMNLQTCYLKLTYSGVGPTYEPADLAYYYTCHKLEAIPFNTDLDFDGIINSTEDLNSNLILNDNDTDNDGIANFRDADDDGDGVLTINEDYNGNGTVTDDDINNNGIIDYLDNTVTTLSIDTNEITVLNIFPNPVNDNLNIDTNSNFDVVLYDSSGRIVLEAKNSSHQISLSKLQSGLYFLKIKLEGKIVTKKIIKN